MLDHVRDVDDIISLEREILSGTLRLHSLKLKEIPDDVFQLEHLTSLDIHDNEITTIPNDIRKLKNLKNLAAHQNKISSVSEQVCLLSDLASLDLGMNKLSFLPSDFGNLTRLNYLRVSGNPFAHFPFQISDLPQLETLISDRIGLESFPDALCQIPNLRVLNISNNNIREIPFDFVSLQKLTRLVIDTDRITNIPIEILNRSPSAIINYLHSFKENYETFELREAKLIIIGEGAVGKTTLMQRLIDDKIDGAGETTEGIEIRTWPIKPEERDDITLNVWDFGGQEIYHSTHQFFLTKRSLYLFIWDARKEDNILNFDYWLNVASLLSKRSPIICVQNKIDERVTTIDEDSIVRKFSNVCSFPNVSAITGSGIDELRKTIIDEVSELEHIGDALPKSWNDVRNHLERLGLPYIYGEEYLRICKTYGIDEKSAEYLSQYYHDLGVFLHFQDSVILKRIVFLDPEWATSAVYRLIDTKEVQTRYGRFKFSELRQFWSDYEEKNHLYLLELMKRFELCFEIGSSKEYIVPELLSHRKPNFSIGDDVIRFEYHYDFMPAGIMSRFIVRCHDLVASNIFWRNGVVLKLEGNEASIAADPLRRKLRIAISGGDKSHLLAIIRRELSEIHRTLNNPTVEEMIPCPCMACSRTNDEYYHSFEYLRRAKSKRKYRVECKKSLNDVRIDEILDGINRRNLVDFNNDHDHINIPNSLRIGDYYINTEIDPTLLSKLNMSSDDFNKLVHSITRMNEAKLKRLEKIILEDASKSSNGLQRKLTHFAKDNGLAIGQGASGSALFELLKFVVLG